MEVWTRFWAPSDDGCHYVGVGKIDCFVPNLVIGSVVELGGHSYKVEGVHTVDLFEGKTLGQNVYLKYNEVRKKKKRWFFF